MSADSADRLAAPARRWPWVVAAGSLALAALLLPIRPTGSPPARPAPPVVVLLVMDTVRRDHLSLYGYDRATSPRLERLARKACTYERAYSTSSWTTSAHASMFTGLYPFQHGATQENWTLREDVTTVAETLRSQGFRTVGIVENPLLSRRYGFAQGFDDYLETWRSKAAPGTASVARFQEVLRPPPAGPLFVFVNLIGAHSPYDSSGAYRTRFLRHPELSSLVENSWHQVYLGTRRFSAPELEHLVDLYDGEILNVDDAVGRMIEALDRARPEGDYALAVVSDHGENFGEHGHVDHVFSLYETTVRVPLVVYPPPDGVAGGRSDRPVQVSDLHRWILDAARPSPQPPSGASRGWPPPREEVHLEYGYPQQAFEAMWPDVTPELEARYWRRLRAIVAGGKKLIMSTKGETELYDLDRDPGESHDLSREPSALPIVQDLDRRIGRLLAGKPWDSGPVPREAGPTMDDETRRALESLGYL